MTEGSAGRQDTHSLLARLAGRGSLKRRWHATSAQEAQLEPWQRGLLAALSLRESEHPSGPTVARAAGLATDPSDWLLAEPIHLAAGLNDMALVPLRRQLRLTSAEQAELTPLLREHVQTLGYRLHAAADAWLIGAESWRVHTVSPEYARRNEWHAVLPQGADAGVLRRLLTELQMLLHEHPVNERRVARGLPAVNSVWFWGNGAAHAVVGHQATMCVGRNEFLRGVCALHEWRIEQDESAVAGWFALARETDVVVVTAETDLGTFESTMLPPLVGGLARGAVGRLDIVLDEYLLSVERRHLRRFWRRDVPIDQWPSA